MTELCYTRLKCDNNGVAASIDGFDNAMLRWQTWLTHRSWRSSLVGAVSLIYVVNLLVLKPRSRPI